jgi:hypothetical protein
MIDNNTIPSEQYSFKDFLFKNRRNRITLILAAVAIVIQFGVFKYFYPFASFIHGDSFVYIESASENLGINFYMIGYSKFLRLFSVFSTSDTALVVFQYLLIQGSALYLIFTLFYFYNPNKVVQVILLCFMVFNPLLFNLANIVSSDGFFLSISLTWFSILLWIIHRPSNKLIIWHTIILFIAFTVRYNALIYPFIAAMAFYLSKLTMRKIIAGLSLGIFLCFLFIGYTTYKYKKLTGSWQYSPFSGWQLANNAMYTYRYVDSNYRKQVPTKYKALDNMIRVYFDSTRNTKKHPQETLLASTAYMWSPNLPLFKYMNQVNKDSNSSEFKRWATMAPLYSGYGIYIIKQYPMKYLQHFIWPNANKYYAPPIEFLGSYNSGKENVGKVAVNWFGYKSRKVTTRMKDLNINVLNFYPILTGTMNILFLCCLVSYILLNGFRQKSFFVKGLVLTSIVLFTNAGFTILSSSSALRFQAFPILLITIFAILSVDRLWNIAVNIKTEDQNAKIKSHQVLEPLTQ